MQKKKLSKSKSKPIKPFKAKVGRPKSGTKVPKAIKLAREQAKQERLRRKYARMGLDMPQPKLTTRQFNALREQWYAKVQAAEELKPAEDRWTDIEWASNPDSPHISMPASRGRQYTDGKQLYFAMARNYLTHNDWRDRAKRKAWQMHTEGASYRAIFRMLKADHGYKYSLYSAFYYVKKISEACKKFNTRHKEGLLNPANADSYGNDALLSDFQLNTAQSIDEGHGMPIDAGFWESVPKPK